MAATPTTPTPATPATPTVTLGIFTVPAVAPPAKQVAAVVAGLQDAWLTVSGNTPHKPATHNAAAAYATWRKHDAAAAKAAAVAATAAYGDAGSKPLAAATLHALGHARSTAGQVAWQVTGTPAKAKAGYAATAYANVATAGLPVPPTVKGVKAFYGRHVGAYTATATGGAAAAAYNALRAAQA
jgi:hypothetical protein